MSLTIEQRKIRSKRALRDAIARSASVRVNGVPTKMQAALLRAIEEGK